MGIVEQTFSVLSKHKFNLSTEALLKVEMLAALQAAGLSFQSEFVLDPQNRPDFFLNGLAIEVKIKGSPKGIYKQCERYCQFDQVEELLLVTNKAMGFPKEINGKSCYVLNLGKAWL